MLSGTIEAIYDSAVSFDNWSAALEHLAKVFRSHNVSLISRNLKTMAGSSVAFGSDAEASREYFQVWGRRNLFVNRTKVWRPGSVETDEQIVPRSDLVRSDYYNEFMARYDVQRVMRLSLVTEAGAHQSISLSRHNSIGEFDRSDVELGEYFMPHLQRAARISWSLHRANMIWGAAAELLEENPTGLVLLDWSGRIVFANRAIRAMAARADAFLIQIGRAHV